MEYGIRNLFDQIAQLTGKDRPSYNIDAVEEDDPEIALFLMYAQFIGLAQDKQQADYWFNFAAAQVRKPRKRLLKILATEIAATKLPPEQMAVVEHMAREWLEEHGQH